jgi:hypothetical protein
MNREHLPCYGTLGLDCIGAIGATIHMSNALLYLPYQTFRQTVRLVDALKFATPECCIFDQACVGSR